MFDSVLRKRPTRPCARGPEQPVAKGLRVESEDFLARSRRRSAGIGVISRESGSAELAGKRRSRSGLTFATGCKSQGYSLLEVMLYLAILGLIAVLGIPPLTHWSARLRLEMAADEIASVLQMARRHAILHQVNVAVKFRAEPDRVTFTLYRDGDGDGVRNRDIETGVDPREKGPFRLGYLDGRVRFGFPPGPPPRAPGRSGRRLDRLEDPIRFNRSDLASFSSLGTATPGTVYLTDGVRHLAAVRVNNRVGKITVMLYDRELETWR